MGISENCAVAPGCCGPDLLYYIQAWEAPKDLGKQSAFILIIFPILREGRAVHTWQKDKTETVFCSPMGGKKTYFLPGLLTEGFKNLCFYYS